MIESGEEILNASIKAGALQILIQGHRRTKSVCLHLDAFPDTGSALQVELLKGSTVRAAAFTKNLFLELSDSVNIFQFWMPGLSSSSAQSGPGIGDAIVRGTIEKAFVWQYSTVAFYVDGISILSL